MWEYKAMLTRVVDGDTIDLNLDLGFGIYKEDRFRLFGIDTPELHSKVAAERDRAQAAKNRVQSLVSGQPLVVQTTKDKQDKYGRYLAQVILPDGRSVSSILIAEGLGVIYDGGARG